MLTDAGIVDEYSDADFTVMMLTPTVGEAGLAKIEQTLLAIPQGRPIIESMPPLSVPIRRMSPREALFSPGRTVSVQDAIGRVLASATVSCPPAIPIVVCGEEIDESALRVFAYYGIDTCRIVE